MLTNIFLRQSYAWYDLLRHSGAIFTTSLPSQLLSQVLTMPLVLDVGVYTTHLVEVHGISMDLVHLPRSSPPTSS